MDMSEVNKDYLHQKSHRNLFPTASVFNGRFPNSIFLNNKKKYKHEDIAKV